ncbi:MAG: hypothetical protein RIS88_2595 [Pseudomonadota bacterium]|jgi:hypothetical protein
MFSTSNIHGMTGHGVSSTRASVGPIPLAIQTSVIPDPEAPHALSERQVVVPSRSAIDTLRVMYRTPGILLNLGAGTVLGALSGGVSYLASATSEDPPVQTGLAGASAVAATASMALIAMTVRRVRTELALDLQERQRAAQDAAREAANLRTHEAVQEALIPVREANRFATLTRQDGCIHVSIFPRAAAADRAAGPEESSSDEETVPTFTQSIDDSNPGFIAHNAQDRGDDIDFGPARWETRVGSLD